LQCHHLILSTIRRVRQSFYIVSLMAGRQAFEIPFSPNGNLTRDGRPGIRVNFRQARLLSRTLEAIMKPPAPMENATLGN
jgi:hypothetical protein